MDSLRSVGQRKPIVVYSDMVVAGNGTLEAARRLGWSQIWVNDDPFESFDAARAYALQDNRSAELATWNFDQLETIVAELKIEGFDIDQLGFRDGDLDILKQVNKTLEKLTEKQENILENSDDLDDLSAYSQKIQAPIYKITGEKPTIVDMVNVEKTNELILKIKEKRNLLSDDVYDFLINAAQRHTIFNYQNIAEFYAHADKELQTLMEDSALVIIDFAKAIENGFVEMSKEISEIYEEQYGDS
jgi:hypothetical protein